MICNDGGLGGFFDRCQLGDTLSRLSHPHLVRGYEYLRSGAGQPPLLVPWNVSLQHSALTTAPTTPLDGGTLRNGNGRAAPETAIDPPTR